MMWRFLLIVVLVLQGCSMVTVDELEPVEEQQEQEQEQETESVLEPIAEFIEVVEEEEASAEEEEHKIFREIVESFFGLSWSNSKSADAAPIQYMALGDSLTRGVGDEKMEYGYTERLAGALETWPEITEVELDNRGKNGRRSDQLLALIERGHYDKELPQADLITMTLGGNDVMSVIKSDLFSLNKKMFDEALPDFTAQYKKIVKGIRARNADVPLILIGFYNPFHIVTDEFTSFETIIDEWNAEIHDIAEADVNACFVPVTDLFVTNSDLVYHTDFFHPNGRGYDRMAARVVETMQACGIEQMSAGRIGFEE